jgi:hypothetical protein
MLPSLKLPAHVSIVHTATAPPRIVKGTCVAQSGDELSLEVPPDAGLPPNVPLIVDFSAESGVNRAIVVVLGNRDGRLLVKVTRVPTPDKREFPRMNGGISLRYHVLPRTDGEAAAEAWMRGGAPTGQEFEPDPFMNFSVTGLAFDDIECCRADDLLGFVITIPREAHTWRGVASVVRVWRIPIDERDESIAATHRIAVNFTELPDDARLALGRHTERIQEAWL